jgi:lauroyl/myristoyl acyltransferase
MRIWIKLLGAAALPVSDELDTVKAAVRTLEARRSFAPSAAEPSNLRQAVPENSDAENGRILCGMWDNLGRAMAE